ncbi:hypothetical protein BFN03_09265 [Rhodococcus sp. WMMA185]|nr:hypothetical protein BFN03_09265 [Rhodococcus sp. WMMA185]
MLAAATPACRDHAGDTDGAERVVGPVNGMQREIRPYAIGENREIFSEYSYSDHLFAFAGVEKKRAPKGVIQNTHHQSGDRMFSSDILESGVDQVIKILSESLNS